MILSDEEFEIEMRATYQWDGASNEQKAQWEAQIGAALQERRAAREMAQIAYEQQIGTRMNGARRKRTGRLGL